MSDPAASLPPPAAARAAIVWPDPARASAFDRWLTRVAPPFGLDAASVRPASADASFRRYFRVDGTAASFIVMDAPPSLEDARPFVRVAGLMREAGVRVPHIHAWSEDEGFLLLQDFGPHTLIDTLNPADPSAARAPLLQAVEALVAWQRASRPGVLPAYDEALLRRELQLFPDWYVARHRGIALAPALRDALDAVFARLVAANLAAASVFVHRDFMPRNLVPADASGAVGVLDFQDAVHGPVTYDIACLMRDAFISWDEEFVLDITVRYWERARAVGLPVDADFGDFWRAVEWMALQRHLKVAGIFARLTLRDGKPRYLADAPRFIGYIRATAGRYRELMPLLRVLDAVEGSSAATGYAFGRM